MITYFMTGTLIVLYPANWALPQFLESWVVDTLLMVPSWARVTSNP